ncbi:unnamed protein product [Strongylus vulgaris]|uniref:Saposin B-type domain-containing protein n=1 Tax=Strongylus vulgaris TaxID=40348 RepID=A0A3P7L9W2_STRVU|nr:unnamed protein product [Strongylus vulgaris]
MLNHPLAHIFHPLCFKTPLEAIGTCQLTIICDYKIAGGIQQFACHDFLGANFTASCDDFLSLYLPTVLYMTFEQYTPLGVCTKTKSCDSASSKLIWSELCDRFVDAVIPRLFVKFFDIYKSEAVCSKCDRFVDAVIPRLFVKFFDIYKSEAVCSKIYPEC